MLSEIGGAIGQYQTNMASYDGFFAPEESGWSICLSEDLSDAIDFTNFMNMDITGEYKITQSPVENAPLSHTIRLQARLLSACR